MLTFLMEDDIETPGQMKLLNYLRISIIHDFPLQFSNLENKNVQLII